MLFFCFNIDFCEVCQPKLVHTLCKNSDCQNSLATRIFAMSSVAEFFKKKFGEDKNIHIIYEDQHSNDFNSLFARVYGLYI